MGLLLTPLRLLATRLSHVSKLVLLLREEVLAVRLGNWLLLLQLLLRKRLLLDVRRLVQTALLLLLDHAESLARQIQDVRVVLHLVAVRRRVSTILRRRVGSTRLARIRVRLLLLQKLLLRVITSGVRDHVGS
jgi:hypothetical protein